MKVVWIGFWTNALSGALLFCISPEKFFYSTLFRCKLLLIATGLILGARLNASLLKVGDEYAAHANPSINQRTLAALSLACWLAAIFAGRWLETGTRIHPIYCGRPIWRPHSVSEKVALQNRARSISAKAMCVRKWGPKEALIRSSK